ncbi:MAG: FAD:protein FMN transferase [Phycisphaerales bacterium]|nr:FAD:protein FMN transferase [Phycisphaerales bacterium]
MATPITVEAPADRIEDAARIVFETFRRVDAEMSEWKDTSPLSGVNRAAGIEPVAVPDELREVIARAVEIGVLTDGAFDLTWAAMWGLWDFKAAQPRVPTDGEIASRISLIDYRKVVIDNDAGTVYLPQAGMLIGLGGIAKGYALDRAADALRGAGIESYLVSAGGQIVVGGARPAGPGAGIAGRPWWVGIRDPRGRADDIFATLELTDSGVSTTGDYERYFEVGGVRYHHVLDPRTGRPSRGVRAVSVVCADATLADALSTALMILGVERGMAVVESLRGVEAVFVDETGGVSVSSGLAGRLTIVHPPRRE